MSLLRKGNEVAAPCLLCDGTRAVELPDGTELVRPAFQGSRVVRCVSCGLAFLFPPPSHLRDVYEEDYFQSYADHGMVFPAEPEVMPQRYIARLAALEVQQHAGRLLDIGCGHGSFLNLARSRGWAVQGLEVSRYAAGYARERYGLDVIAGGLEDAAFPADHFDAIHMSHVLEHLPDPRGTLREALRVLKPQGRFAVEVPNELEGLAVRLGWVLGVSPPYVVGSTHISYFSPRTLEKLIGQSGFHVLLIRTVRDLREPKWFRRILKRVADRVEQPTRCGPLIELMAQKPAPLAVRAS